MKKDINNRLKITYVPGDQAIKKFVVVNRTFYKYLRDIESLKKELTIKN